MTADRFIPSLLRANGVYRFRDREYTAIDLSTNGTPWRSTGLVHWLPEDDGPRDILYLRHQDLVLLSVTDFEPVGTLADLEDTGRNDERAEDDPMPVLRIYTSGDGVWPDLQRLVSEDGTDPRVIQVQEPIEVCALAEGMASGKPSVTVRMNLPDGSVVLGETSLALFLTAADLFKTSHGDPR